jgi:hypothetical protein
MELELEVAAILEPLYAVPRPAVGRRVIERVAVAARMSRSPSRSRSTAGSTRAEVRVGRAPIIVAVKCPFPSFTNAQISSTPD